MLNRKTNDLIFYGTLIGIVVGIFLIRLVVIGGQQERIDTMKDANNSLQAEIDDLSILVQENRNVQTNQLYELYYRIPNNYTELSLRLKTTSILDSIGITDSTELFNRDIQIRPNVTLSSSDDLSVAFSGYNIMQVDVSFSSSDITYVTNLIDELLVNEQLFIINGVSYSETIDDVEVQMTVSFFAVYKLPYQATLDLDE